MNTTKALSDYQATLAAIDKLEANHATAVAKLATVKSKIETWLSENAKDLEEVPEFVVESNPSLAWAIGQKNDAFAIKMHMLIDDSVLPHLEEVYEGHAKPLKALKEDIEKWGLQQLLDRKSKNFKSSEGTGSLRTDVKYQVADKRLMVDWLAKNNAEGEVSITIRPNSKFFASLVESTGELPAGLSTFREQKCVFIKGKEK